MKHLLRLIICAGLLASSASLAQPGRCRTLLESETGFREFYTNFKADYESFKAKPDNEVPIQYLPNIPYAQQVPVRKEAFRKGDLDEIRETQIPERFWPYFSKETGAFEYQRATPLVLSSESGRQELKVVRISFNRKRPDSWRPKILKDYGLAMQKIPGFKLWVSVAPEEVSLAEEMISQFPKEVRERIWLKPIEKTDGRHVWTQDGSKPLSTRQPTTTTPGFKTFPEYERTLNAFVHTGKLEKIESPFKFEGGNIIVGEKHVFIGTEEILANMRYLKCTHREIMKALEAEFGLPIVELGRNFRYGAFKSIGSQADFHIDLSMAVVYDHVRNKEVILLESPELFIERLAGMRPSEFQTLPEKEFLKLVQSNQLSRTGSVERQKYLTDVEGKLKSLGYEVIKIPGYNEDATKMVNFTNAIFSGKNAIIPSTGFRALDQEYQGLLKKLGYETLVPMKVVRESAKEQGGIRCLSETYRKDAMEWTPSRAEH